MSAPTTVTKTLKATTRLGLLKLGVKHWRRDIRSAEMRLLLVATLVAAFSMTLITSFTDRLTRTMEYRASELIAGDLTLRGPNEMPQEWIDEAGKRGLRHAPALAFSTMAYAKEALQLSRVRAVGESYPLKGSNQVSMEPFGSPENRASSPEVGTVWAEQRVLQALDIRVGDALELGDARFTVGLVLQQDADRSGNFYSPFGRILMRLEDVPKTGVVGPGSRLLHKHYFTGDEGDVLAYANWLEPQLTESEKLAGVVESETRVGGALEKAQQYLSLASLVAVLLAGVAIAMASQRFSERHYETAALLRCLGAHQQDISTIFLTKLLMTGLLASIVGATGGFFAHFGLLEVMRELLPGDLLEPRGMPVVVSFFCALVVLMAFALAPIQKLKTVSPVRVLRRELNPKPVTLNMYYLSAIGAMGGLAYILTGHLKLTLIFVIGLGLLSILYGALAASMLVFIQKLLLNPHRSASAAGAPKRFKALKSGFQQLYRHRYYAVSQLGAFAFIFTAITLIIVVRTDLFARWQASIPPETPNHFAINILPDKKTEFESFIERAGVKSSLSYPMVRGRLIEINGEAVTEVVSKEERPNAIQRELNLTWSAVLADDSEILEGQWWGPEKASDLTKPADQQAGTDTKRSVTGLSPNSKSKDDLTSLPRVSVESELATKLNIQIGDELTFKITGQVLNAEVSSIRKVKWDNFKPNFYMVFEPDTLEKFHHTYLNSFYLPLEDSALLLEMNRQFKAVSVIPVEQIIRQVRDILNQTTVAVEYILLLVLAAGILLLFATLLSTLSLRKKEAAIYRTLGAQTSYIRQLIIFEYIWLGLLAGILAVLSTELLSGVLYVQIFEVDWEPHWALWMGTPFSAVVAIVLSGWLASRPVMDASPTRLLREVS